MFILQYLIGFTLDHALQYTLDIALPRVDEEQ